MPRGFQKARQALDTQQTKFEKGPLSGRLFFKLEDSGDSGIIRALEDTDDVAFAYVHEIPVEGRKWGRDVVCVDQNKDGTDCPGCERREEVEDKKEDNAYKRKFRFWLPIIWRDAPVYKTKADGSVDRKKIMGSKDQVAILGMASTMFDLLEDFADSYRGLMSRDIKIKRKGEKLETTYSVAPADPDGGAQPLSSADKRMAKKEYNDLNEAIGKAITVPTYEEFEAQCPDGRPTEEEAEERGRSKAFGGRSNGSSGKKPNPFTAKAGGKSKSQGTRRKSKFDDDEDE